MVAMVMMDNFEREEKELATNTEADLEALGLQRPQQDLEVYRSVAQAPKQGLELRHPPARSSPELTLAQWLLEGISADDDGLKSLGGALELAHEAAAVYGEVLENTP